MEVPAKKGLRHWLSSIAAVTALLCYLAPPAYADTIFGVHAGAYIWDPDVGGSVGQTSNNFDLTSEFSNSSADSTSLYVAVEHFIPLIPNAMLRRTPFSWTGSSQSATGTLGGLIPLSGEIDAEIDLNMTDITLYYELLDNWVSLDAGVTARILDGFVTATEVTPLLISNTTDRVDIDTVIPMLYAHARFDLPFSGLAAGIRANVIGYEESNLSDLEAYLHLEVDLVPLLDVGVKGGLRRLSLDIDDLDNWNSDATIEGAFVGLTAHF